MSWPAHICRKSDRLTDTETIQNKFYPLYNDILRECFPPERFSICPRYATSDVVIEDGDYNDFTITYVIEALDIDSVVLFIEVKAPVHLSILSARKDADKQMRVRFNELLELIKIPTLYGISAFGRNLCYYTFNPSSYHFEPTEISGNPSRVVDVAPMERWDSNIMEEEGRTRFLMLVQQIQAMVDGTM